MKTKTGLYSKGDSSRRNFFNNCASQIDSGHGYPGVLGLLLIVLCTPSAGKLIHPDDRHTGAGEISSWPNSSNHIQGTLASAESIDDIWVIRRDYLTSAERTLALTLQGLVAKEKPAIWIKGSNMTAVILEELRQEGTRVHNVNSVWGLLSLFRNHVNGAIAYNLDTDSINVATSLCGPMRAVAVDESILEKAAAEGLSVLLDVRGMHEARAYMQYQDLFARGVLVTQDESKNQHLRDFAVLRDAFTFYGVSSDLTTRFVRELAANSLVFGWEGEHEWIKRVSQGGAAGVPADWSANLSTLSQLPVDIPRRPRRYPAPVQEGERIIAFVMSDGDNIQWMGGGFVHDTHFWASPHRGTFNMTWEMAPVLAEVAPRVLRHFYNTANNSEVIDDFVTGPSGAGYCYHNYLPDRRAFAELTAYHMRRSRLSIATVLNSGGDMTQTTELLDQPEVMGILYKDYAPYNKRQGEIFWHKGKPCISYRYLLWENLGYDKTPEGVANAIAALPSSPLTDPNSYAVINVHAWSFRDKGGPMEAVKQTIDMLPPGTRVVTAVELIVLLRNSFGHPANEDPNLPIENMTTGRRYDYLQDAIDAASGGDEIVAKEGIYYENINLKGKSLVLRSSDPNNPVVVAATVINGGRQASAVTFSSGENASCVLAGLTITGAETAVYCSGSSPVVANCRIEYNTGAGIVLKDGSSPLITNCDILANAGTGVKMQDKTMGRILIYNYPVVANCVVAGNGRDGISGSMPTITNCTIAENTGRGVSSYGPTVTNSIVYYNSLDSDSVQIEGEVAPRVAYSDVQGNWPGEGNIDAVPGFAGLGLWDLNGTPEYPDDDAWTPGDYHLQSQAGRWDPGSQTWVQDAITSPCIDAGDPTSDWTAESSPDGGRTNMGAYGGTPQASMSLSTIGRATNLDDFETGDFSTFDWMTYGDEDWVITSDDFNSGGYSARAGSIGSDESSTLQVTLDCISGDISFYFRVSSEFNRDYLRFYIDGVEQDKWSGEEEWSQVSFSVTEGTRTFRWEYSKDRSISDEGDTAWIDDIVFPVHSNSAPP